LFKINIESDRCVMQLVEVAMEPNYITHLYTSFMKDGRNITCNTDFVKEKFSDSIAARGQYDE
tara:strand:- start:10279 stop:10467 length:189 start_codon:yes stop_codon:yes gene_type:complete